VRRAGTPTRRAATLVLIPGAWHGGWCWSRVLQAARTAGVDARAITLTGLGERAHLLTPDVDLATHVADVSGMIEAEELEDVVLVAHSYAGLLLGAVFERVPRRIRRLVYLDALVPERSESALELFPDDVARALEASALEAGGERVPPWPAASFGVVEHDDQAWVDRRLTDHPYRTLSSSGSGPPSGVPRTYIACTARQRHTYLRFAEAARSHPSWDYLELPCGHDAMVIAPQPLTELLLGLAAP